MTDKKIPAKSRDFGLNVRDKIRTRDLLVRSQTLYPAELHVHYMIEDISSEDEITILMLQLKNYVLQF